MVLAGETIQLRPSCGVRLYRDARKAVKTLIREPIEFETPDGSYAGMPLFSDMRYLQHKGLVSALFHDKAQPYLLQLEKQFTSWRFDQTIPLTTSYAVRHYMISKMVERHGPANSHTFEMEDDRKKRAVEDTCGRFVDLRRRVLDPSMEQINSETDPAADYTVAGNGQTPVGLTFTAGPPEQPAKPKRQYIPDAPDVDERGRWPRAPAGRAEGGDEGGRGARL
jgi:plasmid replication initiation protein